MKHMITGALLLSATLLSAQEKKTTDATPVTVRIKKVENVNGVEKTTDTTYVVDGPLKLEELNTLSKDRNEEKSGQPKKIVIITDEAHGDDIRIATTDEMLDEQVQRAMKYVTKDGKTIEQVLTVDVDAKDCTSGKADGKKVTRIMILKTVKIVDPSESDAKMLGKQTGVGDGQLAVDNMKFYPNPSNGKFNLDFTLPGKGNTTVNIFNVEGKSVYKEDLLEFGGHYQKEIDISENPKGVYFVKITQGKHSQLKKLVLE